MITFGEVDLGDEAELGRGDHHRSGGNEVSLPGHRRSALGTVHRAVDVSSFHRVLVVGEPGLHPFEEEQAGQ